MPQEQIPREIDWAKIIDTALTAPGDLSGVYDRLYNYSFLNKSLLLMQGVHEPVATKQRWQEIGSLTCSPSTRPKNPVTYWQQPPVRHRIFWSARRGGR